MFLLYKQFLLHIKQTSIVTFISSISFIWKTNISHSFVHDFYAQKSTNQKKKKSVSAKALPEMTVTKSQVILTFITVA